MPSSNRTTLVAVIAATVALSPGCVSIQSPVSRQAVEIVVWAALAAIEPPQPTPAPDPLPAESKAPVAKPACPTGTCKSVLVKP
jgi:hypothetical protein